MKQRALLENVTIKQHRVIYHLLEDLETLINDFFGPEYEEVLMGTAKIKQVFTIDSGKKKQQKVAGAEITQGCINRNFKCRIIRDNETIADNLEVETL